MKTADQIVVISSYPELTRLSNIVLREMKYVVPVTIVEAVLEEGVQIARRFEKNKVGCIISSGATGLMIKNNVSIPVIIVRISSYDILQSIFKAKQIGGKIAYFEHVKRKQNYDFKQLMSILDLTDDEFKLFFYKDRHSLEEQVNMATEWGTDVAVSTGSCTLKMAKERGAKDGIMVKSTWGAVVDAFHQAQNLLMVRKKEQKSAELMRMIVDHTTNGIIVMDGRNIITHFNSVAEKLMGLNKNNMIGLPLQEIPDIFYELKEFLEGTVPGSDMTLKIRNKMVLAGSIPLVNKNEQFGVMCTLQPVSEIQNAEAEIRKKLYSRGLIPRYTFDDIVYQSDIIGETVDRARRYAATKSTVLITGESGTGKELYAHGIHQDSPCRNGPFVAINCSSIPENLLESELFGYSEGAFTGAVKGGKPGLFELAHKGTIFLDEIAEMPLTFQPRLLRVLQERAIRRVGDDKIVPVDVRIIAATNRDLSQMVAENQFRQDLYFRINVLSIHVPPLRKHSEDIVYLLKHFIKKMRPLRNEELKILDDFKGALKGYTWPGNVRELENLAERYVALSRRSQSPGDILNELINDLYYFGNEYLIQEEDFAMRNNDRILINLGTMQEMETQILEKMIQIYPDESKMNLAQQLNISRATLWKKLKEIGGGATQANIPPVS